MKYPINKEFSPYSHFTPPIKSAKAAGWLGSKMRPPHRLWRNRDVKVTRQKIASYDGEEIELLIFELRTLKGDTPCLVYYHGGGFFFGAAGYHYDLALKYALDMRCKVVFVQYRLTPEYAHPTQSEDCYAALEWVFKNSRALEIDPTKIAVGGDSAGGALAAAVCQMARDRGTEKPLFQLLVYPVTDRRMNTLSQKQFTDTPIWNGKLSKIMWQGYLQGGENCSGVKNIAYASPMEAESFISLPAAYVEVAEFDCLRDEGLAYANALKDSGVEVVINQTQGTMHGFDIKRKAPTTVQAVNKRIEYMLGKFTAQ
ncbi:MAG: alpha/beta hydrolase [Candidatus Coproplasma sp.]